MQDDVYLLVAEGSLEAAKPRLIVSDSLRRIQKALDLVTGSGKKARKYKLDLIPPEVLSRALFTSEREKIDALTDSAEAVAREFEELTQEHAGEEDLLADATSDKGKVTKAAARDRLKALENEAVFAKHGEFSEEEIKHLVIDEKWHTALASALDAEVDRLTQPLADRIKGLETRYAEPLPALKREVEELGSRVAEHLKTMGLAW